MESSVLVNHVYSIKLCSGEIRLWKHLGEGSGGRIWWCDSSTASVFHEDSILYAWEIIGEFKSKSTGNGAHTDGC